MNRKLKLMIILCVLSHLGTAQISIKGRVLDKATSEPVPFAHIFIDGTSLGSTSDLYGNFSIKVAEEYLTQELQISCLGFKSTSVTLKKSVQNILIRLEEDILRLDEVVITPETAEKLMRRALAKIYDNYDTTDLVYRGYYKMESKVDTSLVRSIESLLNIYKAKLDTHESYKVLPNDSIYVNEMYAQVGDEIDFKLKAMVDWDNTPYLLKYRDFVREFMYVTGSKGGMQKRYIFKVENMILLQGRSTYVISVTPRSGKSKTFWSGKIFIDEETLAFSKIDVTSTDKMFKKMKTGFGYKLQSKINNVRYDSGAWKESVNYTIKNGKWYFSSVNASKQFLISSKKRGLIKTPATATVEYKTLDVLKNKYVYDSLKYLPQRNEGYWKVERFMEAKYDSTFWNEFDPVQAQDQ